MNILRQGFRKLSSGRQTFNIINAVRRICAPCSYFGTLVCLLTLPVSDDYRWPERTI